MVLQGPARFRVTVDVPLSTVNGTPQNRYRTLRAIAHEAFGYMPFFILEIARNDKTQRACVTLAPGPASFRVNGTPRY